jgi:hypothetical protein
MFAFCVGNRARNNIVHTGKGNLWWLYTGEREYDALKDRRIAESERNVYWTTHGNYGIGETWHDRPMETFQLDEWRRRGYDRTSVVADPLLVDPENEDFSLRPESPALALGFQPIDQSQMGIQPEE